MRVIPEPMAAAIADGVTTFAHVWCVTRRDAAIFGFTDHDRGLVFDAVTCEPVAGLSVGATEKSLGLEVDTASMAGALTSDAITEEDLAHGLWDGARVDVYRVNWRATEQRVHLLAGHIGEVRRGVQAFEAELRGLQAALNVPVGRVFSRYCDADLGDARCGKNIETSMFRGEGVVAETVSSAAFRAEGLDDFTDGWFSRGRIVWGAGGASEVAVHRSSADGQALIELLDAPAVALVVSAAFTIYAGCDKRFETCRTRFANAANFRGFPHMPGNDAVQAGPVAGEALDGSSRLT